MDTLFTKTLCNHFFCNYNSEPTTPKPLSQSLCPYQSPTQNIGNNIFLGARLAMRE